MSNADNKPGLKTRPGSIANSRFLDIALPLLGGLVIAMLAALIMKYV